MSEKAYVLIQAVETHVTPATVQTDMGTFRIKRGLSKDRYGAVVQYLEENEGTGIPCMLHFVRQPKGTHTLLGSNVP